MRYYEINESAKSDHDDRLEAESITASIRAFLERHDGLDPSDYMAEVRGDSFAIQASRVGGDDDLIIVFSPKNGESLEGGYGTAGSKHVIILYCLIGPSDPKYLPTRFPRNVFVHEYQHYLSAKRGFHRHVKPKAATEIVNNDDELTQHYNDPEEINSYYHEFTDGAWSMLSGYMGATVAKHLVLDTDEELIKMVLGASKTQDIIERLTPRNKARLMKRIYRFVRETVRPEIERLISEE